ALTSVITTDSNNNNQTTHNSNNPMYTYKHVKAALIVFLDFVRNNKQLSELYDNNYTQLMTELIKNSDIDAILRNILSQSGQIMNAMEKGENIKVNINGDTHEVDEIKLTKEDENNIDELIQMGFDPTLV